MNKYIYFTATNTTWRVMEALGAEAQNSLNITLSRPADEALSFSEEDMVYIGFPVFGGRVPSIVLERLQALQGNGCQVVVVAVYGNRHYDDAIREMEAFAQRHNCRVVASVAAVAQHSIVNTIATGRPDATDLRRLAQIRASIEMRREEGLLKAMPLRPEESYKEYRQMPVVPQTSEDCVLCGMCARECPVQAITVNEACATDAGKCILCMRCVAVCPALARQLPAPALQAVTDHIQSRCVERREAELFWE